MLRMSWRPDRSLLVLEGVVDRGHREILIIASTTAVADRDLLLVDLVGADIDAQGRDALRVMELDLWAVSQATMKVKTTTFAGDAEPARAA